MQHALHRAQLRRPTDVHTGQGPGSAAALAALATVAAVAALTALAALAAAAPVLELLAHPLQQKGRRARLVLEDVIQARVTEPLRFRLQPEGKGRTVVRLDCAAEEDRG